MSIVTFNQISQLVGFARTHGCLTAQCETTALCNFYNARVNEDIVLAAQAAVRLSHATSINMRWVEESDRTDLLQTPYISSLMWSLVLKRANGSLEGVVDVIEMAGLPAYWSSSSITVLSRMLGCIAPEHRLDVIGRTATQEGYEELRRCLQNATTLNWNQTGLDSFRGILDNVAEGPRRPRISERLANPRPVRPTPEAPPVPAVTHAPRMGDYAFYWKDEQAPPETILRVSPYGCVDYKYAGGYADSGAKDIGAVRRAVRAWRKWGNPDNLHLYCHPARPRLAEFYSLFPEVEIR